MLKSRTFDRIAGRETLFKCENLQRCGAFKIRGATNFLRATAPERLAGGVVAYSSGNHAQAVALAARECGVPATLVMPADAPRVKLEATRGYGAQVIAYDREREDREAIGRRVAEETGALLVPPFDHPLTIAGQGTVALELLEEVGAARLDSLVIPIGGGGLISGCAVVAKALAPGIRIFGVEPEGARDTYLSLEAGRRISHPPKSIADGLLSPMPGELTFPIIREHVEKVLLVTDRQILETMAFLLMRLKILVEPSGAASAAAVLCGKLPADAGRVGVVLSGGNAELSLLARLAAAH